MRSTGGILVAGLLLMISCAGCTADEQAAADAACTNAAEVAKTGHPGQALAIVGTEPQNHEPPSCAATRDVANKQKHKAQTTLDGALNVTPAVITQVLAIDQENPGALAAYYALAAPPTPSGPVDAARCDAAAQLIEGGFPRRALTLAGGAASTCEDEVGDAVGAIARAATAAGAAGEQRATDLGAAHTRADEALRLDRDNVAAQQIRAVETPTVAKTAAERAQKSWATLTTGWLKPVGSLLLPAAVVFVALLAVGRLLTPLRRLFWWLRWQGWRRKTVQGAGLLCCAAAALSAPLVQFRHPFPDITWVWPGALALAGVFLVASWLATGVRLTVYATDSKGADDPAAVARTLAFIAELGADAPHGTIVGRGADVTVLEGAGFEAVTANKVVTFVLTAVRAVISFAPWTVRISRPSDQLLSCSIQRNGRSVGEALVDGNQLGLVVDQPEPTTTNPATGAAPAKDAPANDAPAKATPTVHYERLAAAHVLTTMSNQYKDVGFEALRGVRSWKSLGLQYLAQTDLDRDEQRARRALSGALDEERNPNASYVLQVRRYRTDPKDSLAFVRAFDQHIPTKKDGPRLRAQRQRMLYMKLAALINARYEGRSTPTSADILRATSELWKAVRRKGSVRDVTEEIRPGVAALLFWVEAHVVGEAGLQLFTRKELRVKATTPAWHGWLGTDRGAIANYQLGCVFATNPGGSKTRPPAFETDDRTDAALAIHYLGLSSEHPKVAAWMTKDPQLTAFVAKPEYREHFLPAPSSDLFTLPLLQRYRKELEAEGLTTVEGLFDAVAASNGWLRHVLGAQPQTFQRLCQLVRLLDSVHPPLEDVRIELGREVAERGELQIVDGQPTRDPRLATRVSEAIATRTRWTNDVAAVNGWLGELAARRRRGNRAD